MTTVTLLGLFAAACTTIAYLPQVIKAVKTKQTKDISVSMYVILIIGIASWLGYGLLLRDLPIIVANAITIFLVSFVFILKLKYK